LHFPDDEVLSQLDGNGSPPSQVGDETVRRHSSNSATLVSRLMQVFSKQAALIEALMNVLYEQNVSEFGSIEDIVELPLSSGCSAGGHSPQSDVNSPLSSSNGTKSTHSAASRMSSNGSRSPRSDIPSPSPSLQYTSKLSKLCLAKLDPTGRCVEASGTLRRILLECN